MSNLLDWFANHVGGPLIAALIASVLVVWLTAHDRSRNVREHISGEFDNALERIAAEGENTRDEVNTAAATLRGQMADAHDLTRRILEHRSTYTGPQEQQQWGRGPKPSPTSSPPPLLPTASPAPAAPETPSPMTWGSPLTTPNTVAPPPPPPPPAPPTLTAPVQPESPVPTATRVPGSVDRAPDRVGTHRRVQ